MEIIIKEILEKLEELEKSIAKIKKENKDLKKRISRLEANTDRDLRLKAKRVLGFTLSNVRGYYNAVRSVQGSQIRIYIGKNIEDTVVRKKIEDYLIDNAYWLESDIKVCEDLMAVEKIVRAINMVDAEKKKERDENTLKNAVNLGNGVKKISVIKKNKK